MIVNASETLALSNFREIDAGNLWSYALGDTESRLVHLSDAKRLTLIQGIEDCFAVVHHFEDGRVLLTSHSYRKISETISSVELRIEDVKSNDVEMVVSKFTGEGSVWSLLPKAYVVRPFERSFLLIIDSSRKVAHLHSLPWHEESYGTLYHMILGVTEVHDRSLLLFSFQRDSEPVVYDPSTRKIVSKFKLEGRLGAPQLFLRHKASELWASDYDTMVKLNSRSWHVLDSLKLQEAQGGMERCNIGNFYFRLDESLCVVARPYAGDVVGIDPNTFTVTLRAETGGQPQDVCLLRDGLTVARDLKTGRLLQGVLKRV